MQQGLEKLGKDYVFYSEFRCCTYSVNPTAEGVELRGEELIGETVEFCARILFSAEQEMQVQNFVRFLTESKTFPRMMIELAEEYFSSASFD